MPETNRGQRSNRGIAMIAGERPEFDDRAGLRETPGDRGRAELALREFVARVGGVENAAAPWNCWRLLSKTIS